MKLVERIIDDLVRDTGYYQNTSICADNECCSPRL